MTNLSERLKSLSGLLEKVEKRRQTAINDALERLRSITESEPIGAEWDAAWDTVYFLMPDGLVLVVTQNDIGLLARCHSCGALFWLSVLGTHLFYVARGYIPPNTHRCSNYQSSVPSHIIDIIRDAPVNIPELRG